MLDAWSAPGPELAAVDEIVTITMRGSCVVLQPTCELDGVRTRVFVDALNAAVSSGSVVMHVASDADSDSDAAGAAGDVEQLAVDTWPVEPAPADVTVVRAGVVRVPAADVLWTVDVGAGRFVRSDTEVDVRFLVDTDWTAYRCMWFTPSTVTAATATGSYVLGHRPQIVDATRESA